MLASFYNAKSAMQDAKERKGCLLGMKQSVKHKREVAIIACTVLHKTKILIDSDG